MLEKFVQDVRDFPTLLRLLLVLTPLGYVAYLGFVTQSVVIVATGVFSLAVLELALRNVISLSAASPIFWLGLASIIPLRVLEYGRNAPVWDPYFPLWVAALVCVGVLATLVVAVRLVAKREYRAAICAAAVIPAAWFVTAIAARYLSSELSVHYK